MNLDLNDLVVLAVGRNWALSLDVVLRFLGLLVLVVRPEGGVRISQLCSSVISSVRSG